MRLLSEKNDKIAAMNILICDDIRDEVLKLENAVKETDPEANVVCFSRSQDAIKYFQTGVHIDVCLLDIVMPEMNGIELASHMREAGFNGKIIFLTTSRDYGVESYQVKAYFYLLKPFNKEDIARLINEIKNGTTVEDSAGIKIETRNMSRFVYFYEISFVEVINKNVYFRLLDGSEIVITASLGAFLPQLMKDGRFAQCHRSFVINMDAITQICGKEILLRCGRKAPISRSYKEFNSQYFMYVFGEDKK